MNRIKGHRARIGLACLCSVILPVAGSSQTRPQSGSGEAVNDTVICRVELVLVEVEVKDVNGSPVPNLPHDQFRIYEDSKRQEVLFFSDEQESDSEGSPIIKYRLGYYYPGPASEDWEFRKIRVNVRGGKAQGLRVSYDPPGYFVPPRDWIRN